MREEISRREAEAREHALATGGALVEIADCPRNCPVCLGPTVVQKSTRRHVVTLAYGPFVARETIRVCRAGCTYPSGALVTVRAESLSRLVGAGVTFGYDVEVFVGIERFVHHRQRDEIREELSSRYGISISSGELTELAGRFCAHLAGLHRLAERLIRDAFSCDGGYPLHIDGTGEAGRGTLFVAYAGWRNGFPGPGNYPRSAPRGSRLDSRRSKRRSVPRARSCGTWVGP